MIDPMITMSQAGEITRDSSDARGQSILSVVVF